MSEATINLIVSDDMAAVPATSIISETGDSVFIDIGSGNIAKLAWNTLNILEDSISYYTLSIDLLDKTTNESIQQIFSAEIGKVNEFYITSDMLSSIETTSCKVAIQLEANSDMEEVLATISATIQINKAAASYIKVNTNSDTQVYKRALTFIKVSNKWRLPQKIFVKNNKGTWVDNDTQYEILLDCDGNILYDQNYDQIFVL